MRVFVAGATGVIGRRIVPALVLEGVAVAGMTRSARKASQVEAAGAVPIVCDVYDSASVTDAIVEFQPDLVLHELTDLPDEISLVAGSAPANARIRREGTRNLLLAAAASDTPAFVVQSVAWHIEGDAGEAVREMQGSVLGYGGTVLRYGQFYGPETYHPGPPSPPRIHIGTAAQRTVEIVLSYGRVRLGDRPPGGIVMVTDREQLVIP